MHLTSRKFGEHRTWTLSVGRMRFTLRRSAYRRAYAVRDSRTWWPFWGAIGWRGWVLDIETGSR